MPKFLRYEGQVRNRRLGKRDTSLLIKDIWQEKAAHDAEVRNIAQGHSFADKLYLYMPSFPFVNYLNVSLTYSQVETPVTSPTSPQRLVFKIPKVSKSNHYIWNLL